MANVNIPYLEVMCSTRTLQRILFSFSNIINMYFNTILGTDNSYLIVYTCSVFMHGSVVHVNTIVPVLTFLTDKHRQKNMKLL